MDQDWIDEYAPNFSGLEAHIFSEPKFMERLNLVIQDIYGSSSRVTGITAEEIEPHFYEITMTGLPLNGQNDWVHFFYNPLEKYAFIEEWRGKWVITPENEKVEVPEIKDYALKEYDRVLLVQKGRDAIHKINERRRLAITSHELTKMWDWKRVFIGEEIERELEDEAERRPYIK